MAEFNPELHNFLLTNETTMWTEKGELRFGVHVHLFDIENFVEVIGLHALDDGGMDCTLAHGKTLFVPLHDHFMNNNFTINFYKHCFNEYDLKEYAEAITEFDKE